MELSVYTRCLAHQKDKSCFDLYKMFFRIAGQSREKDQELDAETGRESH